MTRKEKENLCAKDDTYDIDFLKENFMAYNCLGMVGKPKIFLIDGMGDGEFRSPNLLSSSSSSSQVSSPDHSGASPGQAVFRTLNKLSSENYRNRYHTVF